MQTFCDRNLKRPPRCPLTDPKCHVQALWLFLRLPSDEWLTFLNVFCCLILFLMDWGAGDPMSRCLSGIWTSRPCHAHIIDGRIEKCIHNLFLICLSEGHFLLTCDLCHTLFQLHISPGGWNCENKNRPKSYLGLFLPLWFRFFPKGRQWAHFFLGVISHRLSQFLPILIPDYGGLTVVSGCVKCDAGSEEHWTEARQQDTHKWKVESKINSQSLNY